MTDDSKDRSIKSEVHDVTNSQLAVGTKIRQSQQFYNVSGPPTVEELEALRTAFADLRAEVERDAPPEVRDEAVRQTEALQQATMAEKPDVSVMASAKRWFLDHAPGLLGAVTAVVINPVVGKIVSSAGEAIAKEYQKWFPEAAAPTG
jgi:hypothetical protein